MPSIIYYSLHLFFSAKISLFVNIETFCVICFASFKSFFTFPVSIYVVFVLFPVRLLLVVIRSKCCMFPSVSFRTPYIYRIRYEKCIFFEKKCLKSLVGKNKPATFAPAFRKGHDVNLEDKPSSLK